MHMRILVNDGTLDQVVVFAPDSPDRQRVLDEARAVGLRAPHIAHDIVLSDDVARSIPHDIEDYAAFSR